MSHITIIGFGPFGQALTKILLYAREDTHIFAIDIQRDVVMQSIDERFANEVDRMTPLSKAYNRWACEQAIGSSQLVIIAVWSKYMLSVLQETLPHMQPGTCVINVNKWLSPHGKAFVEEYLQLGHSWVVYATLAGGMAAADVMDHLHTRATIAVRDKNVSDIIQKYFESDMFGAQIIDDVKGVEYAWVLKNIISIQAGNLQWEQELSAVRDQIDQLVSQCTQQIQELADVLGVQSATYDQTYCRDHPEYGDIRTSCYGGTRNFRLWQQRAMTWDLHKAIQQFADQHITVEGINTLRAIAQIPDHPFLQLRFVREMLGELWIKK